MEFLVFLASPILLVLLIWLWRRVATYVLGPAAERERISKAQTQFMMADLLWLVVLMQAVLAVVVAYVPRESRGMFELFFVFGMAASTALWWGTMRMVSRAGVRSLWRRGMFVALVAPATLVILTSSGPLMAYVLARWARLHGWHVWGFGGVSEYGWPATLGIVYLLSIPLQMWLLRKGTLWALDDPYSRQLAAEAEARQAALRASARELVESLPEDEAKLEAAARELEELDLDT